jgi:hypothetical protein
MTKGDHLLYEAERYIRGGLSIIAVDDQKKAVAPWKAFTTDLPTLIAIEEMIKKGGTGLAVICGPVSGGLEVLDFDLKYSIDPDLYDKWRAMIPLDILYRLRIIKTRSAGFHVYYRCEVVDGNKKLAQRPATAEEIALNPHDKVKVLIETRGHGGYVVAPPSEGYSVHNDVPIGVLTIAERELVLEAARSFNEMFKEERPKAPSTGTGYITSPLDAYNVTENYFEVLSAHGWRVVKEDPARVYWKRPGDSKAAFSANFHKEKRLFKVFSTSTEFDIDKAYSPSAIFAILEHAGDYSAAAKALLKQGFGKRLTDRNIDRAVEKKIEGIVHKFWEVEVVNGKQKIDVKLVSLVRFLNYHGGFTGYRYNDEAANILVQLHDGIVREVDIYEVKQFLLDWAEENLPGDFEGINADTLLNYLFDNHLQNFSKNFLEFLPRTPLNFLKDTLNEAFFPFRNGVVRVARPHTRFEGGRLTDDPGGISFVEYGRLRDAEGMSYVIWKSQMIDRNIDLDPSFIDNPDRDNIDFCEFVKKVSGDSLEHFAYFITAIGYLLHKYKDPKNPFAIILGESSENEAEGGGTGKGLFMKAIKQLIPTEIFDGKQFHPGKSFAFQRVTLDTRIIAIEDARKGFKFEELYSIITEGIQVEKKNQKEFFIPYADAPKVVISTNYNLSDEGNHAKRRQRVLEFSNYFSPDHTPYDEFKRMFFEEWDADEWNRFFNFMFFCCHEYLRLGVVRVEQSEANKVKNVRLLYGEDLLMFVQSKMDQGGIKDEFIQTLFRDYELRYGVSKYMNKDRFSKGVAYIADVFGYRFDRGRGRIDGVQSRTISVTKLL